jgi:NitT/TauT family transport system permease protein
MIVALFFSILFSLAVGIIAARNHRAETVIIPLLDVLQSIPILGFFPIVIFGISGIFPGPLGVNLAVIFLIFTSMSWNIAFGVYEAVKSIPQDYIDLSFMSKSSSFQRITSLYIPASLSRIAYNTQTSWAVGLFYLVSSEIISEGTSTGGAVRLPVRGIGVDIITYGLGKDFTAYIYSILLLVVAVIIWQFVFLREFSLWSERYKFVEEPRGVTRDPLMRVYHWVNQRSVSKLFLLRPGRGVSSLTSSIARFRRGLKYAILILVAIFLVFELAALFNSARTGLTGYNLSAIPADEANVVAALAYSFVRIWYIYFICVAVAMPLGIVIALHEKLYNSLVPVIEVVASIPAPILLPALVPATMVVGAYAGELTAAIVIFLGMIWYVLFNVMAGIRSLPAELFELKSSLRVSTFQAWRNIYLPAIATAFVTGSITAIGAAWNTLIVAEYFEGNQTTPITQVGNGIGKVIVIATTKGDMLTLGLAVLSMTALVVAFNLTVWRRVYHFVTKRYAYNR